MIVLTKEEFCDNDGVELAVESLNEGHNLSTPGTDKLEEEKEKSQNAIWGRYHQSWQKNRPINFLFYSHCSEAYCSI